MKKSYIKGIIKKQLQLYNLVISEIKYQDIIDSITFELIKTINNIVLRYPGQIVNYLNITLRYRTFDYIIKNIFNAPYNYIDEVCSKSSINDYLEY
ncbi:MAG: hypothetical protein IJ068_07655 [Bacilli bacterium]|nr:hypothetical protein [Bacilli bacterium]